MSEFKYIPNVIFAGQLHRRDDDLAAAIVGEQDDPFADVTPQLIFDVQQSEIAHRIYQGGNRGSARVIKQGQASEFRWWIFHNRRVIRRLISKLMPGVRWKKWKTKFIPDAGKIASAVLQIVEFLSNFEQESKGYLTRLKKGISVRSLKIKLGLQDVPQPTFWEAVELALQELPHWRREKSSLVPVGFHGDEQNTTDDNE